MSDIGPAPKQYPDGWHMVAGITNEQIAYMALEKPGMSAEAEDAALLAMANKKNKKGWTPAKPPKELGSDERKWTEKDFQHHFNKWASAKGTTTAAFELKATPGGSLPFSAVQEHQKANLLASKKGRYFYRISDAGNATGMHIQLPFDCVLLVGVKAFVAIMFNVKRRGNKTFFLIDIEDWIKEEASSVRKSLTEARAGEIGHKRELL